MRDGWIETTLGEIADYINGYPFKPDDLGDQGLPVIRIKQLLDPEEPLDRSLVNVPERCVLNDGDVVFSWSGTLAVRVWNRGPALLNQHLFRVIEKPGVIREWLPLVIDHAIEELGEKSHGTTMKHITKSTLLPHTVTLPPPEVQSRIVDVVSAVDEYIAALQRQADAARTARTAVLHEMLTAGGDDWTETILGAHVSIVMGQAPPGKDCNKDGVGVPFVKAGEFTDGFPLIREWTTNPLRYSKLGDTLICVVGATCGKLSKGIDCAIGRSVAALQPLETIDGGFLWNLMTRKVQEMRDGSRGSAQGVISRDDLKDLRLRLPPLIEQRRIVGIVSSIDDVIHTTESAIAEATSLRSGLLSDLLSGKHGIPASYDRLLGAA
jgi:type I restriction enzyme S subunit